MRRNIFDPRINRHTNQPHEHKHEIARRTSQKARQVINKSKIMNQSLYGKFGS